MYKKVKNFMVFTKGFLLSTNVVAESRKFMNWGNRLEDPVSVNRVMNKPKTIAHRGASLNAPENTKAAFDQAVEMNCDYIELDVQMSKDGKLVIMHDTSVNRTTNGTGQIRHMAWQNLRKLDAGNWFASDFAGERIPLLEEVLDRYCGKIGIIIELKKPSLYPGMIQQTADALKRLPELKKEQVIVQSFDFQSLKGFHRILPEIPVGVLTNKRHQMTERMIQEFATFAQYINLNRRLVHSRSVQYTHEIGMKIMAWNVRKPGQVPLLAQTGVDGIITNNPVCMIMQHNSDLKKKRM